MQEVLPPLLNRFALTQARNFGVPIHPHRINPSINAGTAVEHDCATMPNPSAATFRTSADSSCVASINVRVRLPERLPPYRPTHQLQSRVLPSFGSRSRLLSRLAPCGRTDRAQGITGISAYYLGFIAARFRLVLAQRTAPIAP